VSYKHHLVQLKKNWGIFTLLLLVVFSAGVVWAFTERDFVEKDTFDLHVTTEKQHIDEKFESQEKLINQKFETQNKEIEHLDEHLEDIKELLRD